MNNQQYIEDTITTIVVLSMLFTAVAYLWVITTYIPAWDMIIVQYRAVIFTPCGLLMAGATWIIFRK